MQSGCALPHSQYGSYSLSASAYCASLSSVVDRGVYVIEAALCLFHGVSLSRTAEDLLGLVIYMAHRSSCDTIWRDRKEASKRARVYCAALPAVAIGNLGVAMKVLHGA